MSSTALPTQSADTPSADTLETLHPLFWAMIGSMQDGVLILTQPQSDHGTEPLALLTANLAFRRLFPNMDVPLSTLVPDHTFWHTVEEALNQNRPKSYALKSEQQNQKYFFHVEMIPLTNPNQTGSQHPLCVCIFNDYTTIRRTEKMRRDFVANVSHELRTPLSAIHGYAETLLEGALDDPGIAREFTQTIFRHSTRLSQLVADLLDLSKLEQPDFILDLEPVSLPGFVRGVVSMAEKQAEKKQLSITQAIPENLPPVLAHDRSLEQVITNLLDNAIKYTPEGGKICISAGFDEDDPTMVAIQISDSGMGIPQKHLSRLFERFYRVDKARSRDMGGTGLGLSIVKHIVQSHGGNIWVTSTVGEGTTFTFTLKQASTEHNPPLP